MSGNSFPTRAHPTTVKTEARQRRTPREKGFGRLLVRRGTEKRHFCRAFVFLLGNHLLSLPTSDLPGTLPWVHTHPSWISKCRLLRGARFIMAWQYLLTFDPQGAFCKSIVSPLSKKRREWRSLNSLTGFHPSGSLP